MTHRHGSQITARNKDDHCITRNVSHFKKIPNILETETDDDDDHRQPQQQHRQLQQQQHRQGQRYHYVDQLDCTDNQKDMDKAFHLSTSINMHEQSNNGL